MIYKAMLAGSLLIAIMIIHLNWIALPAYSLKLGALLAYAAVGLLTFILSVPFVLLLWRLKEKSSADFSDAYIDEDGVLKYRLS